MTDMRSLINLFETPDALHNIRAIAADLGVDLNLGISDKTINLRWIDARHAYNRGDAGRVLQALCNLADRHHYRIDVEAKNPNPSETEYYRKFGFVEIDGRQRELSRRPSL